MHAFFRFRIFLPALFSIALVFAEARATPSFLVPISVSDAANAGTLTVYFGAFPCACECLTRADTVDGRREEEYPPYPPPGSPDMRFLDPGSGTGDCFGLGTPVDLRPIDDTPDTYVLHFQISSAGGYPAHISWPSGLDAHVTSLTIQDPFGGSFVSADMLTTTSVDVAEEGIDTVVIVSQPINNHDDQCVSTCPVAEVPEETAEEEDGGTEEDPVVEPEPERSTFELAEGEEAPPVVLKPLDSGCSCQSAGAGEFALLGLALPALFLILRRRRS